jgi:hypothetical protein
MCRRRSRQRQLALVCAFESQARVFTFDTHMKLYHSLLAFLVVLCGCRYLDVETPIIPFKADVTAGHRHSRDTITFLNAPDATRSEVIATLGSPIVESLASRVLLYAWERTWRIVPFQTVTIYRDHFTGTETTTPSGPQGAIATAVQRWGLFIAYSDDGFVCAHEVLRIGTSDLERACVTWRGRLQKNEE